MPMVSTDTLREFAALLNEKAQDFSLCRSPEAARDILVLAECVSAAATGYLIKHKLEGIINGRNGSQPR